MTEPYRGEPAPTEEDWETFASLCKALGHPARIKIVQHLQKEIACICGRIVEVLPLAQSTVSQHLKHLKAAGLVVGEVDGPRICYCLDPEVLKKFRQLAYTLGEVEK